MRDNPLQATLFGAAFLAGFTAGLLSPSAFHDRTFDLVQVDLQTGESDVIDYGLTIDDCRDGMLSIPATFCE